MATIEKRLEDLEQRLQPSGRVIVAWGTDDPDLYELGEEVLTLEAIEARLTPADKLIVVNRANDLPDSELSGDE